MTRNLSAHPALLLNPAFSKCCLSFYMVTTLHNSKILLSLLLLSHSTISNFYQFINQNYLGLVIPFFFFFFSRQKLWFNYSYYYQHYYCVSVTQCYLHWIFVLMRGSSNSQRALESQHPSKTSPPPFCQTPLKSANYPSPLLRQFTPNILVFYAPQ